MEKEIIIQFLKKAGFEEKGKDQYYKHEIGIIFVKKWDVEIFMFQIMELGRMHGAKQIRESLMIQDELFETVVFNPKV